MRTDSPATTSTKLNTLHKAVFTTSARAGWLAILRCLQSERSHRLRVLLPAYVGQSDREGSGIFDPIRETGAQAVFYSIDENLRPNQEQIQTVIARDQIDVVLAVHFFGFCHLNMASLKIACQQNGVALVEDCAHVGLPHDSPLGSFGDFSIYSLHKFFSVSDGGVLKINDSQSVEKLQQQIPTCSTITTEKVLASNWTQIAKRRIDNFQFLASAFGDSSFVRPLWELSPDVVPHNFPAVVQNAQREPLYFYLRHQKIRTTALYYKLVDELPRDEFPKSHDLSNNMLNLSVHQELSSADLENLVKHVRAFFQRKSTT